MRLLVICLGLAVFWGSPARALPRTPPITIDERMGVVEMRRGVPLKVGYDVSTIGGSGLRLRLFRFGPPADQPPVREWILSAPRGPVRLSLGDLPVGVYRVEAVALGPDGQPVGSAARPLLLEYGGPGAWNSLPAEDLRNLPPAFEGVGGQYQGAGRDTTLSVSPATPVVKPGGELVLSAGARGLPEGASLEWRLEGEGKLQPLEGGKVKYCAPRNPGTRVVRVRVTASEYPDYQGSALILVTDLDVSP